MFSVASVLEVLRPAQCLSGVLVKVLLIQKIAILCIIVQAQVLVSFYTSALYCAMYYYSLLQFVTRHPFC